MKNNIYTKNQQGVALLFAIGILSLLMFLGLAFVTNAVLTQKVAYNNASRSQGRLTGKSALNRLTAHLMYFQQKELKDNGSALGLDYSEVYSRANDSGNNVNDQITSGDEKSLLTYTIGSQKYICSKPAKWQFVQNTNDNNKLTSRFAYWVLPVDKTIGSLDLNQVEKGFYHYGSSAANPTPRTYRLGKDIAELNVDIAGSFFADSNPPADKTSFNWTTQPLLVADLESYFNIAFDGVNKDKAASLKWLRKWFTESGNTRNDQEVYFHTDGTSTYALTRFDLARNDWDTALGLGAGSLNSESAVRRLLMLKDASNNVDSIHDKLRFCSSDTSTLPDVGLPYLKQIGTAAEKGNFSDILSLRKQVAANLLDYCDQDSIPTSDVPAASWSITDTALQPKYTGNEKTPYINELALGAAVSVKPTTPTNSTLYKAALEIKVKPELLAEIIDMYGINPASDCTLSTQMDYDIKLVIKSNWTIKYVFSIDLPFIGTVSREGSTTGAPLLQTIPVTFSKSNVPVEITLPAKTGGYRLNGKELDEITVNQGYSFASLASIPGLSSIKSVTLNRVSVQVYSAQASFQGVLLKNASGNMDFVHSGLNIEVGNATSNPFLFNVNPGNSAELDYTVLDASSEAKNLYNRFYLVGLEAKDPRQNLNNGDWNVAPKVFGYNMSTTDWSSLEVDGDKSVLAERLVAGHCNTGSNPSAQTGADPEIFTNPAWVSATEHLSTAYIANKPMKSLWELGAIHRGIPWQTINLKKSTVVSGMLNNVTRNANADGYTYAQGDGFIFDQVKLVDNGAVVSTGKIDLNRANSATFSEAWDQKLFASVFAGVGLGHSYADLHTDYNARTGANKVSEADAAAITGSLYAAHGSSVWESRGQLLTGNFYNGYGELSMSTDAAQEEFVGKTMNLLKAQLSGQTPETDTIKAVIVVQTLKDIGGEGSEAEIIRFKQDKTEEKKNCKIGRFDAPVADGDGFVYFDEITSEVKMLVTYKLHWEQTDPAKKSYSIKVQQIEYID